MNNVLRLVTTIPTIQELYLIIVFCRIDLQTISNLTMTESNYDGPAYLAPGIVAGFNKIFHHPRNFHSDEIVDLLSPDEGEQKDYEYGLIFVGTLISVFFFLWASILVMLKLRGDEVGCASGGSFHYTAFETIFVQHSEEDTDEQKGASGSTDVYDDNDSSIATNSTGQKERNFDNHDDCEQNGLGQKSFDSVEEVVRKRVIRTRKSKRREQRTRSAFIFAGLLSLACNAALLVLVISPFNEVVDKSNDLFLETQDLVDDIDSNIHTIAASRENATRIVQSNVFDIVSFCPNITESEPLESELAGLTETVSVEFHEVDDSIRKRLNRVNNTFIRVQDGMNRIQQAIDTASEYLWLGPAFIVATSFTVTFALFGVGMAMKENMQPCHQRGMTYLVLPLLISVFVACCATAVAASVGVMVTGDACVGYGSPDRVILAALEMKNFSKSSDEYLFAESYTGGCTTAEPTEALWELRNTVESTIATIWYHMSNVDSVGREKLSQQCGKDITVLVEGARDLANILTNVRKVLTDTTETLRCDEIHPLYVKAVQDTLCTDVASGAAWTFMMFFLITIFTAMMISLRASWLQVRDDHEIKEEKEEIRNMNEHAEYLDFVSKYKDEWQDYDGIQLQNEGGSWSGDGSESAGDEEDDEEYDEEDPQIPEEVSIVSSVRTADISFPSLKVPESLSWVQKDNPLDLGAQSAPTAKATILPSLIAIPPTYSPGRSVDSAEISLPNTQQASPVVVQKKASSKHYIMDTRNSHHSKKPEILPTLHVPVNSSDQGHGDDIEVLLGVSPTSDPTGDLEMTRTTDTGVDSPGQVSNGILGSQDGISQEFSSDESTDAYLPKPLSAEYVPSSEEDEGSLQEGRDDDPQKNSDKSAQRPRTLVSARLAAILKRE